MPKIKTRDSEKEPYHHGDLRQTLIEQALKMIHKGTIDQLSFREIARKAKVSHTAPYRHFASKAALLAGVAEEGFKMMNIEMTKTASEITNPLKRFQEMGLAYVRFAIQHPAHFRVMFGTEVSDKSKYPTLFQEANTTFELLLEVMTECQKQGLVKLKGDLRSYAVAAWSQSHGLASLYINGQLKETAPSKESLEKLAHQISQILFFGIKP